MARIGIYGGSFNPPHCGHILAAQQCLEKLGLDRVILVPAAIPPHKILADGSPDAETRLALCRLAVKGVGGLEVSDLELRRAGASYTVDTLREFRRLYPRDELYLLMGTDMFLSFADWREPEGIARTARIVCFYRSEKTGELQQQLKEQAEALQKRFGCEPILLDNDFLDVSSTEIRRLLFFDCAEGCLPKAVAEEIRRKGLYGTREDCRNLPFGRLRERSLSLLKKSRVAHVEGCCQTAQALAEKYGADVTDAARAGILHDVTKALGHEQHLRLCDRWALPLTAFERSQVKLLHAKSGAAVAQHVFGENEAVCSAINWHTTGKADMTTLEKIIYIADYMEPSRDFPGVEQLREAVWRDLDEAVLMGLDMTLELLERKNQPKALESIQAREFLLGERTGL